MFQLDNELKALDEAHAPRLKYFQPVILGGYTKGVPSEVKLWDSKPIFPDDLEPAQREVKFHKNLEFLAEQMSANEEQVEATKRAYGASAGLSLVHGGPKTGKTVTALLQALVAVSMGHKVILCAPAGSIDDLESLFGKHWSKMPDDDKPNVYIARSPASETYLTKYCELAAASDDPDCTMPVRKVKDHVLRFANLKIGHLGPWRLEGSSREYSHLQNHGKTSLVQKPPTIPSFSPTPSRIAALMGLDAHNPSRSARRRL